MKKKVLVFPCGSEIGLEIYNSINNNIHFELYGLSSVKDHGSFIYKNYIDNIGFYTDKDFFPSLKKIIKDYNIDILYPTMDDVISIIKNYEEDLGIEIVGPDAETAKLCASKKDTYALLKNSVNIPQIYDDTSKNINFPIFLKPNIGYGSRNTKKIYDYNDLNDVDYENNILCEYLPGKEYTIDCFTGLEGDLLFVGARERSRTNNGISVNTRTNNLLTEQFRPIAEIINSKVKFKGSWFFQMKNNKQGIPCLLEIACRFAGSSSVHRIQGINFALSSLYLTIGIEPIFILNTINVELDRSLSNLYKLDLYFDTVFIDYDDTIICENRINLDAITFLFHCLNKDIKIYLVTKHNGDLLQKLKSHKIENVFTDIFHIKKEEKKIDYIININYKNSIFIDDSFQERKEVFETLNIPVFGIDAINALINK